MATLNDIASWVQNDMLKRTGDTDIQAVCKTAALNTYNLICAAIPFDELQTKTAELALVVGQAEYTIGTDWIISPTIRAISDVRITFSSTDKQRLRKSHVRLYDSMAFTSNSRPSTYARSGAGKITINPPPDSASYTVMIRYWLRPVISATPSDTVILTPTEWEELYRWETLYRVYYALDKPEKAMMLRQPGMFPGSAQRGSPSKQRVTEPGIIPCLWNNLLRTVSQHENTDEDFSVNPLIRTYSLR